MSFEAVACSVICFSGMLIAPGEVFFLELLAGEDFDQLRPIGEELTNFIDVDRLGHRGPPFLRWAQATGWEPESSDA